jgi:hypothetical protein
MARLLEWFRKDWKSEHAIMLTHVACLTLGVILILWGVAPALIERLISRKPATFDSLAASSVCTTIGLTYVVLNVGVRRRSLVSTWIAFVLSALLCGMVALDALRSGMLLAGGSLLIPTSFTAFSAWLAIGELSQRDTSILARLRAACLGREAS